VNSTKVGSHLLVAAGLVAGQAEADAFPLVVNECSTGSSGWVELLNRGPTALELTKDPRWCWLVDDVDGGGAPKAITDANVNHAVGSTTCSSRGRPPACGVVAPGERVWVRYAYLNATTGDQCRVISAPKVGAACGSPTGDPNAGGPTTSSTAAQCFGRKPDGGPWVPGSLACTQGASNGACTPGAVCDDGNVCMTGKTFTSTCQCSGGTPVNGASCGVGKACGAGTCVAATSPSQPVILKQGTNGLRLTGTIVTPDTILEGEVLVVGDEIRCVAASCETDPAAATASLVQTNGIIYPGLIDTHNHIQFDIFDETDWAPESTDNFTNHNQWPARPRYKAMVDTK